jgi:DNA polymerase
MQVFTVSTFEQWRDAARRLLHADLPPSVVTFMDSQGERTLWGHDVEEGLPDARPSSTIRVPSSFLDAARQVACHRDRDRWNVLYRLLWRLTHGEPELMQVLTDDDVHYLVVRRRQVRRDVHRMHAFVRFRKCISNDTEWFVAWYRPDHRILRLAVPFFVRCGRQLRIDFEDDDVGIHRLRSQSQAFAGTDCGGDQLGMSVIVRQSFAVVL